ncbi:MAG TPA: carbohydrate kinase family protein [Crenotrichaceae bacterium]|nr:carbohydrate kinase family protein [Crenotrichaceae bacterium]
MSVLITGSMAYDTIMVFHDRFKEHILPDQVHILNVAFLVPELRREFGGCAGNIAYNLKLLGGDPLIMATVGQDFSPYAKWLEECGINQDEIWGIENAYTAQAFITTDLDDNQITAFHPGAMSFSHQNAVPTDKGIALGTVSPDGKDGMILHAKQFADADIPFIFDPGQGMPMFSGDELLEILDLARWVTLNDYEASLMEEKTGLKAPQLAEHVDAAIITRGSKGSEIYTKDGVVSIPPVTAKQVVDPTGCGDAYRAGLLYGMQNHLDWETTGRIASLIGAIKVASAGTQNHSFTLDEFRTAYKQQFNSDF